MMRAFSADAALFPASRKGKSPGPKFKSVEPSGADRLILPAGYRYDLVASYGDPLGTSGPMGPETFGYDNDFLAYFPMNALRGGNEPHHGLLWVNHEYLSPMLVSGVPKGEKRTPEMLRQEHQCVGGSVIEVKREAGKWKHILGSKNTRRFTADYPEFHVTGPVAAVKPRMKGTLANCSGGRTLWSTALSGEENYHLFNAPMFPALNWGAVPEMAIREDEFGWIIEVDPFGELPPKKHTALGRFAHENASLRLGQNGHLVVYMGDDANDQYLYKFVSAEKYDPKASRAARSGLLEKGTLYAADFMKGIWIPLDPQRTPALKTAGFKSPADVAMRTREAAKAAGATPIDRPEDCEVNPIDGSVYVALTNNTTHGNAYGQIVRLVEKNDDAEATSFRYEIFLAGGPQSGLAAPDNLAFDAKGNLWVGTDISSYAIGKGIYDSFGNNGLFMVPTVGVAAGTAHQFASGPVECELTGPWFNENFDTLFLSVQHPGEETTDLNQPTSRWPSGKGLPKPAVVAITGF